MDKAKQHTPHINQLSFFPQEENSHFMTLLYCYKKIPKSWQLFHLKANPHSFMASTKIFIICSQKAQRVSEHHKLKAQRILQSIAFQHCLLAILCSDLGSKKQNLAKALIEPKYLELSKSLELEAEDTHEDEICLRLPLFG